MSKVEIIFYAALIIVTCIAAKIINKINKNKFDKEMKEAEHREENKK